VRDSAGMRLAVLSRGDGLQRSASASSLASRNSSVLSVPCYPAYAAGAEQAA
jgi:hypothetical protein